MHAALMTVAMMAPLLTTSLAHVSASQYTRARAHACSAFLLGYGGMWAMASLLLTAAISATDGLLGDLPEARLALQVAVLAVATTWQASPWKQVALNRCHRCPPLPATGRPALLGAVVFGLTQGLACVAACWALMLLTMAQWSHHLMVMIAVTVFVMGERLERPEAPTWRWRGIPRLARLARSRTVWITGAMTGQWRRANARMRL